MPMMLLRSQQLAALRRSGALSHAAQAWIQEQLAEQRAREARFEDVVVGASGLFGGTSSSEEEESQEEEQDDEQEQRAGALRVGVGAEGRWIEPLSGVDVAYVLASGAAYGH
eukprot:COSAG01_NODE_43205_length_432_cov_0.894895_1_plen_111_part_01